MIMAATTDDHDGGVGDSAGGGDNDNMHICMFAFLEISLFDIGSPTSNIVPPTELGAFCSLLGFPSDDYSGYKSYC